MESNSNSNLLREWPWGSYITFYISGFSTVKGVIIVITSQASSEAQMRCCKLNA